MFRHSHRAKHTRLVLLLLSSSDGRSAGESVSHVLIASGLLEGEVVEPLIQRHLLLLLLLTTSPGGVTAGGLGLAAGGGRL